jgi:group I intron endonuclease
MININSSTPTIGIYKITSPSGKIYIGQSVNIALRWNQYKLLYKTIMGPKLYHSLKKYGCDNHTFEVIEECNADQLDEREIYWGQHYNVLTEAGLNLKLGESNGYYSDETKQKMSEAMMGRKITWKAGRRKGYVMTEEQKILHRKPKSEEAKQKMRKPRSEKAKRNMSYPKSETAKQNMKWARPERECPYCHKLGKGAVMDRFHFNKCKHK